LSLKAKVKLTPEGLFSSQFSEFHDMPVITLTTDLGLRDYSVASIKAKILSQWNEAVVVDISHEVAPYNSLEAAWHLRHAMLDFPPGTVHIIGVNPTATASMPHLVVKMAGQYFIGADNGIFSLISDAPPESITEIAMLLESDVQTFVIRDVFVKAACYLAKGGTPEVIGKRASTIIKLKDFSPMVRDKEIMGDVICLDRFNNAHTNISEVLFKSVGQGRAFEMVLPTAKYKLNRVHRSYSAVEPGQAVAIFSQIGMLELAINLGAPGNPGGAGQLLGLRQGSKIKIEFNG